MTVPQLRAGLSVFFHKKRAEKDRNSVQMSFFCEVLDKSERMVYNARVDFFWRSKIMTKTDLVEKLHNEYDCTKKDAEAAVSAVFDAIREALASGDKVTISKFGTFEVRERSAKVCKNPRTGEPVEVAASNAPVFKASKTLKEAVNQ